ncbi:hypothetical protein NSK_004137 [Nannochloropsis salina CCMP1776]|uniref:Uncharacterized protein n=1 Tax=Nannochloropsis salina CCMP1776 TaxID=1027361 RepID=A0A4D9D3S4_9STRA|nr:hypothetical protein NSK_004137 [Nannochloropsis salina CCMP1776]|eukprot:TFJ84673.1 hypothetical protein NSK_004137 [Nannochloropsis salina CCMP1776]
MEAVNGLLAKLASDSDFQDDLRQPQVRVALKHWTNENRLPALQAEKLMKDYRVLAVLQKLKSLQTACQRAGMAVPLDAVLRQEGSLGSLRSTGAGSLTSTSPSASVPEKEQPEKGAKTVSRRRGRGAGESAGASAASSVAPARPIVQVPETVAGWAYLLSPLVMLGLGLAYFVYMCLYP